MRCLFAAIAALVLVANALTTIADAAGLPAGDIVVSAEIASGDWGLIEINPITGDRTILSDNTHGTGMPFTLAAGVQVMANGDLLVADAGAPDQLIYPDDDLTPPPPGSPARLYLVDPTTGNRTVISQDAFTSQIAPYPVYPQIGSGAGFGSVGEARQVGNQILAIASNDGFTGQLMSVDPTNGNRSIVSGGSVGSGTQLFFTGGFSTSGNTAFEPSYQGLFRIDLTTGNRTIIAGPTEGTGARFVLGRDVASYYGQLYVSGAGQQNDPATYGVFRIDPNTGDRSVVTNGTVGSGPFGNNATLAMAIESGGTILLTVGPDAQDNFNGLLTVDPMTGNRAFLSDATHGTGASFMVMYCVTVVPLAGDANGDGITNSQDLATISSQWNQSGYFLAGDLNGDGIVNTQDLALVSANWLGTSLGHSTAAGSQNAAVPEPSTLILAAIVGLAMLLMRRRR